MNWQRKARLVIALAGVAFAIMVAFFFQRRATLPDSAPIARTDPAAVVESSEGTTFRTNLDKEKVRIEFDRLLSYADGSTKMLGLKVTTVRGGGRTFTVTGKQGQVEQNESNFSLVGDVHLTATDGLSVRAERATYSEKDGIVRAPGPVEFARGRLRGTGVGMTYDKNQDVVTILDQVVAHVSSDTNRGMDITSGFAELDRGRNVIRFDRGMKATRAAQTIQADVATAHLAGDDNRLGTVELRGNARITGATGSAGGLQAMTGRDIDLKYAADGETLEHALIDGTAVIQLAGESAQPGRQITAGTIDVSLAPDGSTPTALTARDSVELTLPAQPGAAARTIRADNLDAKGAAKGGLTSAHFTGGVSFHERAADVDRTASSEVLDAALKPGFSAIDEATFTRRVVFTNGKMVATAAVGRYALEQGVLELSDPASGGVRPNVKDDNISIDGERFRITLAGPNVEASGAVKSVLQPAKATGQKKTPSMLKQDQPVTVTADELKYDGKASKVTYTGNAQLWQAETTIKANTIVVDDKNGDLTAAGEPVATTAVLVQERKDGTKERKPATAKAKEFRYEEALRRATYAGDAYVNGPQGELRAARIELYLTPSGDELERAEAFDGLTLGEQRRKTTGARMTYFSADERYVVTGTPVKIVDECGRETTGKTLTFYKAADRIVVDGAEQIRTQTKGAANCP